MLVLTRRVGEKILIGDDVVITVLKVKQGSNAISIGIDAPKTCKVNREEVAQRDKAKQATGEITCKAS